VQVAEGDLAGALTSYRDGLAIIDRLAKSNPNNAGWQRDLSGLLTKVGDPAPVSSLAASALRKMRPLRGEYCRRIGDPLQRLALCGREQGGERGVEDLDAPLESIAHLLDDDPMHFERRVEDLAAPLELVADLLDDDPMHHGPAHAISPN
jgi:hypothetical protein